MIAKEILSSTGEAAYAVDHRGKIVSWNRAAEKTFGYRESLALGRNCWELLSGRDVFGNRSCCEGCPVRATAFNDEPINQFQVDFKTATKERVRFTVSTLMLYDGPSKKVFVHLCHPESDVNESTTTKHAANHSAVNNQGKVLTARESEVLSLLHQGMTVTEVAIALDISTSTVRNHTQHIFEKLQVHSRFEAVALGRRLKLI